MYKDWLKMDYCIMVKMLEIVSYTLMSSTPKYIKWLKRLKSIFMLLYISIKSYNISKSYICMYISMHAYRCIYLYIYVYVGTHTYFLKMVQEKGIQHFKWIPLFLQQFKLDFHLLLIEHILMIYCVVWILYSNWGNTLVFISPYPEVLYKFVASIRA